MKYKKAACLEEQLFRLGLIVPIIIVPLYYLYAEVLLPLSPFKACMWDKVFGIYCPGCGGTRAIDALLQGDFLHSFLYHPFILYVALVFAYYYISAGYTFLIKRNGKIYYEIPIWILIGAVVVVIVNFIVRNILLVYFKIDFMQDLIVYW